MPDVFVSPELKTQEPSVFHAPEKQPVTPNPQLQEETPQSKKPLPLLAAFCENPVGVRVENQEAEEHVILFLRRHFITNLSWASLSLVLLVTPLLLFLAENMTGNVLSFIPVRFLLIFGAFYYLIVLGFVFLNFITWFYNVGIITNQRILDLDFRDIMYRHVAVTRIEDVIDVEFSQGGFLHSFFEYGNVFIQTEGIKPNFEFQSIPKPSRVADILLDQKGDNNV